MSHPSQTASAAAPHNLLRATGDRLADAFARAIDRRADAGPELRALARDFVRALKASGAPPEQVVVSVKATVARLSQHGGQAYPLDEVEQARARLVQLCIAEYYADGDDEERVRQA